MDQLNELSQKLQGLFLYSESEYPFTILDWGNTAPGDVAGKIAATMQRSPEEIHEVAADDFFARLTRVADPEDTAMADNAAKAKALHQFLQDHCSGLQVYRVEGQTQIPVFITGFSENNTCIALQTMAVET